jgi:hypothetical protein
MPVAFKYAILAASSVLWLLGLADQLHSWEMTGKYLVISALMAVLALL